MRTIIFLHAQRNPQLFFFDCSRHVLSKVAQKRKVFLIVSSSRTRCVAKVWMQGWAQKCCFAWHGTQEQRVARSQNSIAGQVQTKIFHVDWQLWFTHEQGSSRDTEKVTWITCIWQKSMWQKCNSLHTSFCFDRVALKRQRSLELSNGSWNKVFYLIPCVAPE